MRALMKVEDLKDLGRSVMPRDWRFPRSERGNFQEEFGGRRGSEIEFQGIGGKMGMGQAIEYRGERLISLELVWDFRTEQLLRKLSQTFKHQTC